MYKLHTTYINAAGEQHDTYEERQRIDLDDAIYTASDLFEDALAFGSEEHQSANIWWEGPDGKTYDALGNAGEIHCFYEENKPVINFPGMDNGLSRVYNPRAIDLDRDWTNFLAYDESGYKLDLSWCKKYDLENQTTDYTVIVDGESYTLDECDYVPGVYLFAGLYNPWSQQ